MSNQRTRCQITVSFTPARYKEITQTAEEGEWPSRSDYIRQMVRAGESRVAELDPRISSTDNDSGLDVEEKIIEALDDNWQSREQVLETVLDNIRGELATALHEKAENEEESPIEFDPAEGYCLEE